MRIFACLKMGKYEENIGYKLDRVRIPAAFRKLYGARPHNRAEQPSQYTGVVVVINGVSMI